MKLDASPIVPFDSSAKGFAILKNHYHPGLIIHLFFVVEAFGIGLLGWHTLAVCVRDIAAHTFPFGPLSYLCQCRANKFPVHVMSSQQTFPPFLEMIGFGPKHRRCKDTVEPDSLAVCRPCESHRPQAS